MHRTLSYKTKQFFFVLIKLSIILGAFYFIYHRLTNNDQLDFSVFVDFLEKKDLFSSKHVLFVLLLTTFNWFFEILKWQNLVSFVKNISIKESIEQSLGALTASLLHQTELVNMGQRPFTSPSNSESGYCCSIYLGIWLKCRSLLF